MHDILITSFATWKRHHRSNASDDLLQLIIDKPPLPFHHLRRIPVDFELSVRYVLDRFRELKPKVLICCGMAEKRSKLNVESQALLEGHTLNTRIDLKWLTADLPLTMISHDAGRFVCNHLYYRALEHAHAQHINHYCVFVHVPIVTEDNRQGLQKDFAAMIDRLSILA